MADRLGVMYLGRIVEIGPAEAIFRRPATPTRGCCWTRFRTWTDRAGAHAGWRRGAEPDRTAAGCAFHPRCPLANERCRVEKPVH